MSLSYMNKQWMSEDTSISRREVLYVLDLLKFSTTQIKNPS
jgi:hypothetical protein